MTNDDKMTKCASAFDTGCVGRVNEDGQTDNDKKKKEAQKRTDKEATKLVASCQKTKFSISDTHQ